MVTRRYRSRQTNDVLIVHASRQSLSTYAVATTIRHPREAADQLYWVQSICQQARVPRFDVRVAADVLLAGRYRGLPMCVEEIGESRDVDDAYATASDDHLHSVTRQLDVELLHSFLSIVDRVPEAFRKSATIKDGVLTVRVEHEFELTVSMRGDVVVGDVAAEASDIAAAASSRTWLWVPLRLRMLVPRKRRMSTVAKHDVSSEPLLNDHQMHAVLGMLHDFAIYPHKENPFPSLYEFLRRRDAVCAYQVCV